MKNTHNDYIASLLGDMEQQLNNIEKLQNKNPLPHAEKAIQILTDTRHKLKDFLHTHKFRNEKEEIHFFKHIKPQILSRLLYYNSICHILLKMPPNNTADDKKKYYQNYLDEIHQFFCQHRDFIAYYRAGVTNMDQQYFTRQLYQHNHILLDNQTILQDPETFTPQHKTLSQLLANDQLQIFLNQQIANIENAQKHSTELPTSNSGVATLKIKWKIAKAALIELIYALHFIGAFGKVDIQDIAEVCQATFCIDLGEYYHTFSRISRRKSGAAKFLLRLISNYERAISHIRNKK